MKVYYFFLIFIVFLFSGCKNSRPKEEGNMPFQEKHRPQVHFSPAKNWMNDPNGLVYHNGEYHLFYQHYPEKPFWGPMHWGHAVSRDLVHWEHLPIALYPDSLGYIFSGSAVVDLQNTSGLGSDGNPPLIAFFTYHDPVAAEEGRRNETQSQAIAYSTDNGRSWTKYAHNPVIKNPGIPDFRDPKVIWHEETQKWVMSIAAGQVIQFYTSPNCIDWTYSGEFGEGKGSHEGVWECPDLFPLKVKNTDETKWVLIVNVNPGAPAGGSGTQYFVGEFDGRCFQTDQEVTLWMDFGKDNYAGVTWNNAPDERRILIGWMNNWQYANEVPTEGWRGAATFPRELGLEKVGNRYLLTSDPVPEIEKLYGKKVNLNKMMISGTESISDKIPFPKAPIEITLTFDLANKTKMGFPNKYGITLKNSKGEYYTVGYDNIDRCFYVDRTRATGENFSSSFPSLHFAPYIVREPEITWRMIIDVSSVELFAADGKAVITDLVFPSDIFDEIELFAENGRIEMIGGTVSELNSIWNK